MESSSSNIFEGYRTVGNVTSSLPFIVRHAKNPQDSRIVTIVGKTFHTYSVNLSLLEVSIPHEHDISLLSSDDSFVYSASGGTIFCWGRGSRTLISRFDDAHKAIITHIAKISASRLVSIDEDNVLLHWDRNEQEILNIISIDTTEFKVTALCHPKLYKNKVLLGSEQGKMRLIDVSSEKTLYEFNGWNSKINCIVQSPVEDVVGIGLADGHVHVHNIKYDGSLVKIYQEYGPVTSMSFRLDGLPYLVTASEVGHIMIWNLERKRLSTQIRNAHSESITKCQFFRGTSYLVTSGTDNTLKIWSLDMSDGGGNMLCQRAGHSKPPNQIRFYGPKGLNLLSAGGDSTLKMFHMYSERLNRNLGTARMNPKSTHKENIEINRLPPITYFASESIREKQWDNIVACHEGMSLITSWNYDKCRMGDHIIIQPTFDKHDVAATSINITSCGNFFVVGFNNGIIFKYNIQSGIFRHSFEDNSIPNHRAHDGSVQGVVVDGLSLVLISAGIDSKLKLWNFKSGGLLMVWDCASPISRFELHKDNNLLAVAMKDNGIEIMDLEARSLVRKFQTKSEILDMAFSPDSRWLIVSHNDKSIRTWDLSLGKLIDAFALDEICTSLAMSATGEFLATAHEDCLGITVWSNYTIYCPTIFRAIDPDAEPRKLDMPYVKCDDLVLDEDDDDNKTNQNDQLSGNDILANQPSDLLSEPTYISPDQLSDELITVSGLAPSRWKNLLVIDEIREKQLIEEKENNAKQVKVPFFIPVKDGLRPRLDAEPIKESILKAQEESELGSKIKNLSVLSPVARLLVKCANIDNFAEFFDQLKELGPSATDAEIRSIGTDCCGDNNVMISFLDAIKWKLSKRTDYELANSWLALFLKAHSDLIQKDKQVQTKCLELENLISRDWDRLRLLYDQVFCVLNFVRSSIL